MQPEIENGIKDILCNMLKEIVVHKLDDDNMIFEINYDKYVEEIKTLLES